MTAHTAPDWAAITRLFRDLFRQIANLFLRISRVLLLIVDVIRGVLGPYTEGVGRCHGPMPLAVDGQAYRRRLRRR